MRLSFARELRHAARNLGRRPLFATLAVATIGVGTAASTVAFVLVHSAFLAPLPFAEPDRLTTLDVTSEQGYRISTSVPNYRDWTGRTRVFERAGASAGWDAVLSGHGPARVLEVREVLGDFFGTLGLQASRGRVFTPEETERGAPAQVVLSDGLWRELGADPSIVGQPLTLGTTVYTVVGVLPPGVGYPSPDTAAYLPLGALGDGLPWDDRDSSFGLRVYGRMKPGVSRPTAQADLDRVTREIREAEGHEVPTARLQSLSELLVGRLRQPTFLLAAAAALLVTLALANVVGLFLARGDERRVELAVRSVLGAPRGDLVRLQLAEGSWLTLGGGLLGVTGAQTLLLILAGQLQGRVPFFVLERLRMGTPGVLFAAGLLVATLALVALLPAWVARGGSAAEALAGSRSGATRRSVRYRSALVVGELALGAVLAVSASLLVGSFESLRHVDKGFDERDVVTSQVSPPAGYFRDIAAWRAYHQRLLERSRSLPGVQSASLSLLVPLSDRSWEMPIFPEGVAVDHGHADSVLFNVVSKDYFTTLGVPLLRGRTFQADDRAGSELVAVVDQSLADRYWPGEDPIGRQVAVGFDFDAHGGEEPVYRTVVGVVRNLRHYELQSPSRIQVYIPLEQIGDRWDMELNLEVRTAGATAPLLPVLRRAAETVDPGVPLRDLRPLASNFEGALAQSRLLGETVSAIGSLALLLAGVGAFALASYSVSRRRRELGLRQALGATPRSIFAAVLAQGFRWSGLALAIGLPLAAAGALLARSLLFGVGPLDPRSYLAAAGVLAGISLAACLAPGLRAMRVHPAEVLREEG